MAGVIADDVFPLEDLVDVAGWMALTGRIPKYLDWDEEAADEARAEAQAAEVVAMGEGFL